MILHYQDSLVKIPPKDYPKYAVDNPFKSNRIKDFCKDGIADNHPEWVVSKENGEKFLKWISEDFKRKLSSL